MSAIGHPKSEWCPPSCLPDAVLGSSSFCVICEVVVVVVGLWSPVLGHKL